jgi:hypothetical protein
MLELGLVRGGAGWVYRCELERAEERILEDSRPHRPNVVTLASRR